MNEKPDVVTHMMVWGFIGGWVVGICYGYALIFARETPTFAMFSGLSLFICSYAFGFGAITGAHIGLLEGLILTPIVLKLNPLQDLKILLTSSGLVGIVTFLVMRWIPWGSPPGADSVSIPGVLLKFAAVAASLLAVGHYWLRLWRSEHQITASL